MIHPGHLTKDNYKEFFHTLLWLDEVGAELMLDRYNMENITMSVTAENYLELEVPGLAEKRPSLISGDIVSVRAHGEDIGYKGVIRQINDTNIWIAGIQNELKEYIGECPETELDVAFELSRLIYERMHSAIDRCMENGMLECLFPDQRQVYGHVSRPYSILNTEFINREVMNNAEQQTAVINLLNCTSHTAPYIIFGPPGTGKTITIVEAILQIKNHTKAKILVCAPANAACDMLTERLVCGENGCTKSEIIRVHAQNRNWNTVPKSIQDYSNYKTGMYVKLSGDDLRKYRVVVTTLVLIGRYSFEQKYHPDFVFIDEAAQATEPEALIPISLLSFGKHIILAGDPKQLGPQCNSKVAEELQLGVSLLERLMNLPLYQNQNQNFITMLKQNYRTHPTVLQLPNQLFYYNQLQAISSFARTDPIANIFIYHKIHPPKNPSNQIKGEPVEFCSVFGQEKREGRSPSFYNQNEAQMVLQYVKALLNLKDVKVSAMDIGIITPYIRQMHRIKQQLIKNGCPDVEVGTTEAFQGREKRIMIISTVRAQPSLLLHDRRYKLGFIKNEKRFNVALTRAMSKLIVIGCPQVLRYDTKCWLSYINFCKARSACFGADIHYRTDNDKKIITERMDNVKFQDVKVKKKK